MFMRLGSIALAFVAALATSSANAEGALGEHAQALVQDFLSHDAPGAADKTATAKTDSSKPAESMGVPPKTDSTTPYPHIYQAPLFGSLFAVTANDASVDESALRYYASLHNVPRANAEIRRLKALHPTWTPPTNIYSSAGAGADEQPFWDMLAADRIEELKAGIAMRMKSEAGWKPSRDLTVKIERKEAIERLVKVSDAEKWTDVLDIADADPSVLHCAYMDADWRVADAFLKINMSARAFEIYHAIIATCADHEERVTTIRKAISRFSVDQAKSLIAMGAKSGDGASEFDAVKIDLTRSRIGAVNAGKSDEIIEAPALADFFAEAARTHQRPDLSLAGWFEYNRGAWVAADKWFKLGVPAAAPGKDADDVNFAEGHALSLLKAGQVEPALHVAWEWRNASTTMRQTYISAMISLLTRTDAPPAISDSMLQDFVIFVETDRNFEGGQALAWYRQNRGEFEDSVSWFKTALGWKNVDPTAGPAAGLKDSQIFKAIEGYSNSLSSLGRLDEAVEVADAWRGAGPELRALFVSLATNAINAAEHADSIVSDRLIHFAEMVRSDHSVDGATALGWLDYRSSDYGPSIEWFRQAIVWSPTGKGDLKINQGLALALKQSGNFVEAEEIAWTWRKSSPDMRATYISSFVAQLSREDLRAIIGASRLERFIGTVRAEKSSLGAQALGWYRMSQGNCAYASPWFRFASAWSADREEDAKIAEGLALSLNAVGQFNQAEDIAFAWRDRSADMRALYFKVGIEELTREIPVTPMSEERLTRFSSLVLEDRHALGAQAIGWRRYRQAGCGYGADWFRLATLWVDDDKRDAKTDEGFGLTLRAVGRLTQAESIAKRWAEQVPLMKKLYIDVVVEELARDNPPEPVEEARLTDFVGVIEPLKSPLGAQALGWYRLERGEMNEAAKWFKNAVDWWPPQRKELSQHLSAPVEDYKPILAKLALHHEEYRRTPRAYPNSSSLIGKSTELYVNTPEGAGKTMEGYALTLRALGRVEEAEKIAYAWRERWPSLRALFVDIATTEIGRTDGMPVSPERMMRFVAAINESRSASGASAMAWRQYAHADFDSAAEWFRYAMDWTPGTTPEPRLVEGYVIALRSAKKYDEALAVAGKWRGTSPRFNVLYLETSLLSARDSGQTDKLAEDKYAEVEAAMSQAHAPDGALSIGWIAYESHDYARAMTWFKNALDWSGDKKPDPKALEGLALTLRSLGRYEDLAAFSRTWRDESFQVRGVYYGGMIEWLTRASPIAEVKPETQADFEALVDEDRSPAGAQAVAWSYALRKDWANANTWFRVAIEWSALDLTPPRGGAKVEKTKAKLIEGYVQALRGNGDLGQAEDIAFAWRDGADELRGLYMQVFTRELADANPSQPISAERLARFAKITQDDRSAVGAQNMGWLSYRAKDWNAAIAWFEKAMAWSHNGKGDAKTSEGYALALRAVGRLTEAEDFAWIWRDQSREMRAAYVAAVSDQLFNSESAAKITPARLERFAGIVRADKFAAGAQAMGWRRLREDGNCGYSPGWFRAAIAWTKDHVDEDKANSGLAQGLRALGMFNEAEDVAFNWIDKSREMRELYLNIGVEELTRQWPRIQVTEARISRFGSVVVTDRSGLGAQAIAWRRYGDAGCGYGGEWFHMAASWTKDGKGDAKLNEGWSLTQRVVGRLTKAEFLAFPWIEKQASMKKLYIDVVVEALSRDNPPEPMPEARIALFDATITPVKSALGAQALAWYRFARGENDQAAKWFQNALEWWPHPKAQSDQKLSAPVEDYKPILASPALKPEDYHRTPRAYPNSSLLIGRDAESYVDTQEGLAKTVEGYVLTLAALNRWEEAENLAFTWRDRSPLMRDVLIQMAVTELTTEAAASMSQERVDRFAALIEADHSGAGAEALGWRQYAAQDFDGASRWFKSSFDWSKADKNAAPNLNLVQAYVMSLRGAKQYGDALRVLAQWRDKLPSLQTLAIEVGLDELQTLDPAAPDAARKLAELATGVSKSKSPEGALSLGWLAYQRREYPAAQAWFKQAIVWSPAGGLPDAKALEGYARCLQAEQRFADFLTFTDEWGARVASLKPLFLEAAAQTFGAAAASGEDIPNEVLVRAGNAFAQARSANGAQALAWQRVGAKDWVAAEAWFQAARNWSTAGSEDPKIVEGLIIALRNLHKDDDAEAIAFAGAARDDNLRDIYIEIVADRLTRKPPSPPDEKGMRRYAEFVLAAKSANGGQALGWYSFNARQLQASVAWFEKSLSWDPSESAALGLAYAYRQIGDKVALAKVFETYRDQYGKVADLAGPRPVALEERRAVAETGDPAPAPARARAADPADVAPVPARTRASAPVKPRPDAAPRADGGTVVAALNAKDYPTCVARADAAAKEGGLNVAQQNAAGWCLLNLNRAQESLHAFEASLSFAKGKQHEEAAYGKSLALLAGGQAMQAGAVAAQANLTPDQRQAVGVQILARRAWDSYNAQHYAEALQWLDRRVTFEAETRDLMQLRSWCLEKLGKSDQATAIQAKLDALITQ